MRFANIGLQKGLFLGLLLTIAVVAPFVVFGSGKTIYVDKNESGSEDGSKSHPYHTISKALKNAHDGDTLSVSKGTYKENVTLPQEVALYARSGDRGDVTIEAKNTDKPTIEMKHGSELSHVTIKNGRHGIRVLEDSKVHIFDVHITGSNRDGIHIDSANVNKKKRVLIDKVEVEKSDRSGIYSEKRFLTIINSDIHDNQSDGLDLAAGTHAWLEDNTFNDNRGSGAKLVLDNANIWSKSNAFKKNGREGIEISSFGEQGTIGFKRATISGNNRYGVARIGKTAKGMTLFGNVDFGIGINASTFKNNTLGGMSPILSVQ